MHLFLFPIWLEAGIKIQDAIVFSWTVNCGSAGNKNASETSASLCFKCSLVVRGENSVSVRCDLTEYCWPNKDAGSKIAIEMTSLWHKTPCFIPMQNFWQDSEHHVWIVGEKSKRKKGLIGLSDERGRTFWGRSRTWNQQNSFNIPNPGGGVAVLHDGEEGREGGRRLHEIWWD